MNRSALQSLLIPQDELKGTECKVTASISEKTMRTLHQVGTYLKIIGLGNKLTLKKLLIALPHMFILMLQLYKARAEMKLHLESSEKAQNVLLNAVDECKRLKKENDILKKQSHLKNKLTLARRIQGRNYDISINHNLLV